MIRLAELDTEDGTAQLSSLLMQLNADTGVVLPPPSPTEAMAIYSIAVRLAELRLTRAGQAVPPEQDVALTRDVLLGTRRLLRAALARLEPDPVAVPAPRLVLIDGGTSA